MLNHKQSQEKLQTAIDRILEIDEAAIGRQALTASELQICIDTIDPEFNVYCERHCNKTGKPLGKFSCKAISQLIHIHGRNKAKFALECMHISQHAVEWLYTDSDALSELSKADPVGYFIYSISQLFKPDYKRLKMQNWEIHQELVKGWYACNYLNGANLNGATKIAKANELMRRLLGIANPQIAYRHMQFTQTSIAGVTCTLLDLDVFIAEVEQALIALVEHNWKEKHTVSSATIADLKNTYQGATAFHQQVKLRGLSQVEAILYDLRDFMDGKAPDSVEVLVGHGNDLPKAKFETAKPIELKVVEVEPSEAPAIKQNPFAAMFAKEVK